MSIYIVCVCFRTSPCGKFELLYFKLLLTEPVSFSVHIRISFSNGIDNESYPNQYDTIVYGGFSVTECRSFQINNEFDIRELLCHGEPFKRQYYRLPFLPFRTKPKSESGPSLCTQRTSIQ